MKKKRLFPKGKREKTDGKRNTHFKMTINMKLIQEGKI